MRLCSLLGAAALFALPAVSSAAADAGPGDCLGVDFDVAHPITIAKIIADQPRVYFIKSASDDASCPAAGDACREMAYLIPGNLALIGKTFLGKTLDNTLDKTDAAYTCVSYESADAAKVRWTAGWIPSASMTPVLPEPAPSRSDWIGDWVHASGHITITNGKNGGLDIHGEAFYAAAQNVHTGVIDATAKPAQGLLQFGDDGTTPFDKASDDKGSCLVRMQRVEALLVVEDNTACGGVLVTFTGFYRRTK